MGDRTQRPDGSDLPGDGTEPYAGFQGRVGRTFAGSDGWWPPRAKAPEGAPNVVIVLVDDLGFADVGCFGAEIDTPNIDALAAEGVRYTNFHSAPMCSPTRASLLTGLNPHDAGLGSVAHSDAGFPGYAMELAPNAATMAEILRDHGYATFAVGKWHLSKDSDQSDGAPKHSWPCQRGFDRYYGVLDAFTNLHMPHRLVEDNHAVEVDEYPADYYFTDDITDRAISMVRSLKASDPTKPFFLYFAHGAVHAPLHAKAADIEKYRGRYDAGWDAIREARRRRQQELGVVPAGLPLAPRNSEPDLDVPAWDDLSDGERRLFARYMEVYAAMVDNVDQNLGRLLAALEEIGERENTVVIFTSDNGASREGEAVGTTAYYVHLLLGEDIDADLARIDEIGGPTTIPHYPRGWAMAGNTPWRLYKINTHAGGHTVPTVVAWPRRLREHAGSLRDQYVHVTDVLPTLLEVIGLEAPRERGGVALRRIVGASFLRSLTDADAPSAHAEQHYESWGSKGFYRDGWEVVTNHRPMTPFSDDEWELYDLRTDRNELHDLRAEHPERLRELADAWEQAAWANQVFPLDEGSSVRYLVRPPRDEVYTDHAIVIPRGTPTLERWRSVQLIWFRSFRVTVALELGAGDRGVLVAHGDQGGGYALYVLDDHLHFVHNDGRGQMRSVAGGPIPAGTTEIVADFAAPGKNVWTVTLSAGGAPLATLDDVPMLYGIAPFEGIDVGVDRRSPVSWELWERFGSFPFSGTLHSVRYEPGDPAPDSPNRMIDLLRELGARYE